MRNKTLDDSFTKNYQEAYKKLHDHLSTENIPFKLSKYGNYMVTKKKNLDRKGGFTPAEVNQLNAEYNYVIKGLEKSFKDNNQDAKGLHKHKNVKKHDSNKSKDYFVIRL